MNSDNLIQIFHIGFIICLAFCIMFLVISVLLFFIFDIKTIFSIRTGRAQKKKISEMAEQNALTGRLLSNANSTKAPSMSFSTKLNNIKKNIGTSENPQAFRQQLTPQDLQPQQAFQSVPQQPIANQASAQSAPKFDSEQTTLLDVGADQTSLLSRDDAIDVNTSARVQQADITSAVKETKSMPKQMITDVVSGGATAISTGPVDFEIGGGATMQLSEDMLKDTETVKADTKFIIVKDIMLIHTDEMIS